MFYRSIFLQKQRFFSFLVGENKHGFVFALILMLSAGATAVGADANSNKLRKQAQKAMRQGDFVTAENLWQELVRIEPDEHEHRLALSYALYKQRKLVESYEEAMRVEQKKPNNARVRSIVGAVYVQAGRLEEAHGILNAALALDSEDALALANSAMLDYYENRSKIGLAKLRRAVYLDSDEPDFTFSLAQVAARLEYYREAADAYERFLRIAPLTDTDRRERIQGLILFLRYLGKIKSLYAVANKRETSVACQIVNNRPVIEVRLNDKKEPLRFVLDTGSGMTVISDETARLLGIKPIVRGGMARAVGGGGKFPIVYGFLNSLSIGDVRVERVPIYIRKFNDTAADKFDGYLGLSVISKFVTTLDYSAKTFSLVRNTDEETGKNKAAPVAATAAAPVFSSNALSIPLRTTSSGFLSGAVKVEGVAEPLNFILDTGASISVVSAEAAKRAEISRYTQTAMLRVFGAAGVAENVSTLLIPRLTVGDISRERVVAAVLDLQPINETSGFEQSGIIGGNFLLHYRLTLNFKDATVTFEPTAAKKAINGKKETFRENLLH